MTSKASKTLPVCEACRLRKVKCDSGGDACRECIQLAIECVRTPQIRFKLYSSSGRQDGSQFPAGQAWNLPRTALRYHDETPEIIDMYRGEASTHASGSSQQVARAGDATAHSLPAMLASEDLPQQSFAQPYDGYPGDAFQTPTSFSTQPQSPDILLKDVGRTSTGLRAQESLQPWPQSVGADQCSPQDDSVHMLSQQEAILLRHFSHNMALWADGTDQDRNFELEAPKQALTNPMLLYAICAFASRHMNRHQACRDSTALEYQTLCLQLLIPAISGPQAVDESVVTAVAILRQNEEMDGNGCIPDMILQTADQLTRGRWPLPPRRCFTDPRPQV